MKRLTGYAVAGALATGLMSGCATELQQPDPGAPVEQQIAQIEHNFGFGNTLGKLALSQSFIVSIPARGSHNAQTVEVFNFTGAKVATGIFAEIVNYDADLAAKASAWNFPISYSNPDGTTQQLTLQSRTTERKATVHDFVLLPPGTPPPTVAYGANSETHDFSMDTPGVDQTISFVYQPRDANLQPEPFLTGDAALETEACQATIKMVSIANRYPSDPKANEQITAQGQETLCGTVADTQQAVLAHKSYPDYADGQPFNVGTVPFDNAGDTCTVGDFTYTVAQYEELKVTLELAS